MPYDWIFAGFSSLSAQLVG